MKSFFLRLVCMVLIVSTLSVYSIPAFAASDFRVAKIADLSGIVKVKVSGGEKEYNAFKSMSLDEGDRITTGSDSWVTIYIDDDKEIKLAENSVLDLSRLQETLEAQSQQTGLSLWAGKLWAKVKKKLNMRSKFEIKTPTTTMGVKGTQFFVGQENGRTNIAVLHGTVVATTYIPRWEAPSPTPTGNTGGTPSSLPSGTPSGEPDSGLEEIVTTITANQQITIDTQLLQQQQQPEIEIQEVTAESLDSMVLEEILEDPASIAPELIESASEVLQQRQEDSQQGGDVENTPSPTTAPTQTPNPTPTPLLVYDEQVVQEPSPTPVAPIVPVATPTPTSAPVSTSTPPTSSHTTGLVSVSGALGVIGGSEFRYAADNDVFKIKVIDTELNTDAASQQSVNVRVTSDSYSDGYDLTLQEEGTNSGIFTNQLTVLPRPTPMVTPASGQIFASPGDSIEVSYRDEYDSNGITNHVRLFTMVHGGRTTPFPQISGITLAYDTDGVPHQMVEGTAPANSKVVLKLEDDIIADGYADSEGVFTIETYSPIIEIGDNVIAVGQLPNFAASMPSIFTVTNVSISGGSWEDIAFPQPTPQATGLVSIIGVNYAPAVVFTETGSAGNPWAMRYDTESNPNRWKGFVSDNDYTVANINAYSGLNAVSYMGTVPYVLYINTGINIKKFNGSVWDNVGSPTVSSTVLDAKLATAGNTLAIAYSDSGQVYCKSLVSGSWVDIGTDVAGWMTNNGFTGNHTVVALNAYDDGTASGVYLTLKNSSGSLVVLKYDGTSWTNAETLTDVANVPKPVCDVRDNGDFYITYKSSSTDRVVISKFNGSTWVEKGNFELDTNIGQNCVSMSIDEVNGYIYIAYVDSYSHAKVKFYNGTSWSDDIVPSNDSLYYITIYAYDSMVFIAYWNSLTNMVVKKMPQY